MLMRAISLWQPWATLMVIGAKEFETRDWGMEARGRTLIHAAKTQEGRADCSYIITAALRQAGYQRWEDLPFGGFVGYVDFVRCERVEKIERAKLKPNELEFGNWSPGRFVWQAANPVAFADFYPYRGQQAFFNVDSKIFEQLPATPK